MTQDAIRVRDGEGRDDATVRRSPRRDDAATAAAAAAAGAGAGGPDGQRFRLFVEMMPHLAWMAGSDGAVHFRNRRWSEYAGPAPDGAGGPVPPAVLHPEDAGGYAGRWRQALEAGEGFEVECRLRRASDGAYRWHLCQASPMRDEGGRVTGWCGTCTDVDDRIRAVEDMRHLERFLESIVDHIPDAVFVKDAADLRFVRLSKAMIDLCGFPAGSAIGMTDYDFFPKEEADFFTSNDRAVLASGRLLEIPDEPMHTPKGVRFLHTKKIPILDEQGRPQYLLGITRDITERKRAEEQLKEKNRLLEEAARAEHEALEALKTAQGRLVQSEKLAGLGQLVAGVAHEINNPLAFVANNLVVLERDFALVREVLSVYQAAHAALASADPEAAGRVGRLAEEFDLAYTLENLPDLLVRSREGLRRIRQIVRDLSDFARHESVDELQERADLNAGVQSTVNIVHGRARTQGVDLELDLAPLPAVTCYLPKINQVVLNLLTNAIDACGRGGTVTVRTRAADGGVEIQVADNGSGIDPDVLGKVFDPFFTTKPQGRGTGLGLSISHGIVCDHGGQITVDSTPGRGATFTVRLPLTPPAAATKGGPAPDRTAGP